MHKFPQPIADAEVTIPKVITPVIGRCSLTAEYSAELATSGKATDELLKSDARSRTTAVRIDNVIDDSMSFLNQDRLPSTRSGWSVSTASA